MLDVAQRPPWPRPSSELGYKVVYSDEYNVHRRVQLAAVRRGRCGDADVQVLEFIGEPDVLRSAPPQAMEDGRRYRPQLHAPADQLLRPAASPRRRGRSPRNVHVRTSFTPLELADENPAIADYLELMERYNPDGKIALLGMQALSACLLFAQAAKACGADLTRTCLLEEAAGHRVDRRRPPRRDRPGRQRRRRQLLRAASGSSSDGVRARRGAHRAQRRASSTATDDNVVELPTTRVPATRDAVTWTSSSPPTITGLATAGIFAIAASGLVLTYTTTGIFNFAHGAIGMLARLRLLAAPLELGAAGRPSAVVVVLFVLAPLFGVLHRAGGHARAQRRARRPSRLVVSVALLAALPRPGPWIWPPDQARPLDGSSRATRQHPRGHGISWHDADRARPRRRSWPSACASCCATPGPASPCGPSSTTEPSPSLNGARPDRSALRRLGDRLLARRPGRHPDRPAADPRHTCRSRC